MSDFQLIDKDGLANTFREEWNNSDLYINAQTSGSTGSPKAIRILKKDMIKSAEATCSYFSIRKSSTLVCPLSMDYIAGKMMLVRAFVSGAKLIVIDPSLEALKEITYKIDLLPIVPAQIERLCSMKRPEISNVIIGGAPISESQRDILINSGLNSHATYGMTETCSHVAISHITPREDEFEALPGIHFRTNSDGCLIIEAPNFAFKELHTRDVVELIDTTHFYWRGRLDNVINSGALKFYPEEIETDILPAIKKWPEITDYYITSRPSDKWGREVVLVIETDVTIEENKLFSEIRQTLKDKRQLPKAIISMTSFDRTGSGKVRRIKFDS